MITLNSVAKRYGDFFALKNIDLSIGKGEFVAITGNSGSGKSTLLNIIGLIEDASNGDVLLDNVSITKLKEKEKSLLRNKRFGFIFQAFYLESLYSVYKNIEIPLIINGMKKKERKDRINEMLKIVGLTDKINNTSSTLSGGEKQRAAIARALICEPDIIIADEPCGNLDSKNSKIVLEYLKRIHEQGKTIILVTHNLEDVCYAQRVIKLSDGEIVHDS